MRIAMVTTQYLPVISGVSYYIRQLSESLVKKRHQVIVYTIGSASLPKTERIAGVLVKRFLPTARLFRGYEYCAGMKEEIIKDAPDIINSHHYGYYPASAGLKAAKTLGVPHVMTPVLTPPIFTLARKILFLLYHSFQGKATLSDSDAVLPLSQFELEKLAKLGADRKKMHVIYNPINTSVFRPKTKKGWKHKKLVIYVGPLGKPKGADVVFRIAENVLSVRKDIAFVFVGGGPLKSEFMKKSKKYRGSFVFREGISDEELSLWYSRAHVMLWPTQYEAFGRAAAEAMASGTPVIGTRVGALPEVIVNGKTGYIVDYGDWGSMQEKLAALVDDSILCKRLRRNARLWASENFMENAFVKKHLKIFAALLEER